MYLIYGNENYLIDEEVKQIINKNIDSKIIIYNHEKDEEKIINELISLSIFNNNKIIIFKNFENFLGEKNKIKAQNLINALKTKNDAIKIIFVYNQEKINESETLFAYLKKEAKVKQILKIKPKDINNYVNQIIKQKQINISSANLMYLLTKLPQDLSIIVSELEKLNLTNEEITKEIIDESNIDYFENQAFAFIESFSKKDYFNLILNFEKRSIDERITNFIVEIFNLLKNVTLTYWLVKNNKSIEQISNQLNKKPFYIQKCKDLVLKMGIKKITYLISSLNNMDLQIKKGLVEEKTIFKNFLITYLLN